jgi:hypothetical protein
MVEKGWLSRFGTGFVSKNFEGAIRNDNLPEGGLTEVWFKKPIAEEIHYKVNDYSNAWWIDPAEVCKDNSLCTKNEDGTWDVTLVVEKKTNGKINVLLALLWVMFAGAVGYLAYGWFDGGVDRKSKIYSEKIKKLSADLIKKGREWGEEMVERVKKKVKKL